MSAAVQLVAEGKLQLDTSVAGVLPPASPPPASSRTMTASITMGDSNADPAQIFPGALATLLNEVFKA
ncbi:hypothetical protein ACQPXM_05125 [Kribbella sp. CA-253562]|uniref:hypothetical protein n=1 Tax=Kribbella sp. CA-253562 TaxID=3239942 RepID=UPI003D8F29E6